MIDVQKRSGSVRWQTVALPTEHGGWGFISEPILLGILIAPSLGGFALSVAAFAAFLLRHPLKLYLKDVRAGRNVPRTLAALRFVMIYGGVMTAAGVVFLFASASLTVLLPLMLAAPFFGVQLWLDVHNKGRSLLAELAGATATGAFAAAIVLVSEWPFVLAMGLWLALAVKSITAVLYVRSRLRLERGLRSGRGYALAVHGAGLAVVLIATAASLVSWAVPIAFSILTLRAVIGLSSLRRPRPPKVIGILEMVYGFGYVLLIAIGHFLG